MRKSIILTAALALALIIPAAGCAAVKADDSQQPPGGMPALHRVSLADTDWVLDGYGNPDSLTAVINGSRITLKWKSGVDSVSGNAGCNIYGGKSLIHDGMLTITELYSTEMACATPGLMDQEMAYLNLLGKAQTWNVENGKLIICCTGGEVLVYSEDRSTPTPINSLANTKWSLNSFGSGDSVSSILAGTTVTLSFNKNATEISGTGGVNAYGGNCQVNGTKINIRDIFSTKMFRDNPPGLMNQESLFFELLGKAVSFEATTEQLAIQCQDGRFLGFMAE